MKLTVLDKTNCPHCGTNLVGNIIPDDIKTEYGNATHFSRIVGLYDQKTQRIKAYECPDCEKFLMKAKK